MTNSHNPKGLRKITKAEAEALNKRPLGKQHPVRAAIDGLAPGEILHVPRTAFTWKGKTPQIFCKEISAGGDKKIFISWLADKSGWIVERLPDDEAGGADEVTQ